MKITKIIVNPIRMFVQLVMILLSIGCVAYSPNSSKKDIITDEHQSENLGNYQPTPQERESFDKMFRPANVLKVQTLSSGIIKIESSKSGYIEIYSTLDLKTLIKKELISSNDSVEIPIKAFQSGEYLLYLKSFSDNAVEEIATFKIK